ncbi:MAG: hypothetical protein ACOCXH_00610 [Cyclobacteriaceae bacterium]
MKNLIIILTLIIICLACNDRFAPFQETLDNLEGTYQIAEARFLSKSSFLNNGTRIDSVVYNVGIMHFSSCSYNSRSCEGYIHGYPIATEPKNYFEFKIDNYYDWNQIEIFPVDTVSNIIPISNTTPMTVSFVDDPHYDVILNSYNRSTISIILQNHIQFF